MREIFWASFILSAASYLAACLLFLAQARRLAGAQLGPMWAPRLLKIGAVLQLAYLILYAITDRRCPVFSVHSALGIVSLVGVASYAVLSRGRRLEALGAFVAASAAVFLVTARLIAAINACAQPALADGHPYHLQLAQWRYPARCWVCQRPLPSQ
jgi:ABC-type uncharacterized transport system permease subunit